jgi:hypothetical protein
MKKQFLAVAVLAAVSFGASAAEPLKYTYVEADIARTQVEVDNTTDLDFDGWNVRGSYEFAEQFHVFGGYQQTNNDDFFDIDLKEAQIGFGWHPALSDDADAILEISYLNQKADTNVFGYNISADEDLYRASVGFRAAFNDVLVGTLKANYTDGQDSGSEFTPSFGLEARFNQTWSIVGEAEAGADMKRYTLGVRASF